MWPRSQTCVWFIEVWDTKASSGRLVATTIRNSSNIYVLSEIGNEKCFLGKEDEVWLWHRRMGHIKFDNPLKFSKKEIVKECPKSQSLPTPYASIVYKERKQRPNSNQRNTPQQDHWKLCILI